MWSISLHNIDKGDAFFLFSVYNTTKKLSESFEINVDVQKETLKFREKQSTNMLSSSNLYLHLR